MVKKLHNVNNWTKYLRTLYLLYIVEDSQNKIKRQRDNEWEAGRAAETVREASYRSSQIYGCVKVR